MRLTMDDPCRVGRTLAFRPHHFEFFYYYYCDPWQSVVYGVIVVLLMGIRQLYGSSLSFQSVTLRPPPLRSHWCRSTIRSFPFRSKNWGSHKELFTILESKLTSSNVLIFLCFYPVCPICSLLLKTYLGPLTGRIVLSRKAPFCFHRGSDCLRGRLAFIYNHLIHFHAI